MAIRFGVRSNLQHTRTVNLTRKWVLSAALGILLLLTEGWLFFVANRAQVRASVDFAAYYHAARLVLIGKAAEIYDMPPRYAREFAIGAAPTTYLYSPLFATLFAPLARAGYGTALAVWKLITVVSLALSAMLVVCVNCIAVRRWQAVALLILLLGLLRSQAVAEEFRLGQVDCLLLLLLTASLWCAVRARDFAAGALIGIAASFKVMPALFLLGFMRRPKWRVFASAGVVALAGLAISIAVAGCRTQLRFLTQLRMHSVGSAYFQNQSLNGFFQRLLTQSSENNKLISAPWLIQPATLVCSIAALVASAAAAFRMRNDVRYCYALISCTILLVSPVAWIGQEVLLLLPLSFLLGKALPRMQKFPEGLRTAAGIYIVWLVLVSFPLYRFEPTSALGILGGSRQFVGIIILFGYLLTKAFKQQGQPPEQLNHTSKPLQC